jgi:DNA-binding response OmpR family regulator
MEDVLLALEYGASDYLLHPVDDGKLLEKVERLLRNEPDVDAAG